VAAWRGKGHPHLTPLGLSGLANLRRRFFQDGDAGANAEDEEEEEDAASVDDTEGDMSVSLPRS
jgi:hypothetical protein